MKKLLRKIYLYFNILFYPSDICPKCQSKEIKKERINIVSSSPMIYSGWVKLNGGRYIWKFTCLNCKHEWFI